MAITSYPAVTLKRIVVTLTSGTSWTVPTGVTYVNVTLFAGGQGGGASSLAGGTDYGQIGTQGKGGQVITSYVTTTPAASIIYAIGAGGLGATSAGAAGAAGGNTTFTGATTGSGGTSAPVGFSASNGGTGGGPGSNISGAAGGAGKVEIEYWV